MPTEAEIHQIGRMSAIQGGFTVCAWPRSLAAADYLCRGCIGRLIDFHDAHGDGSAVNALCSYARSRFGPGLRW